MQRLARLAALLLLVAACAHTVPKNEYGLAVVSDAGLYRAIARSNPDSRLVDLEKFVPGIRLDVRYATANNFMKRVLYPEARAFLRRPAALALRDAQEELRGQGLGLKVFDAYRPYAVTRAMWEPYRNPDYVADPAKGSRHNRGAAVDLTLVRSDTGEELEMPTPYDDFTERAGHAWTDLPPEAIRNRALLRSVMEKHGFQSISSEWWHYDYSGWRDFDLMDVPFAELE